MAISKLSVKNFTVFKNIEIDFCEGVNILIGENGTGKTHIMKLLYGFCNLTENTSDDPLFLFNRYFLVNKKDDYKVLLHNKNNYFIEVTDDSGKSCKATLDELSIYNLEESAKGIFEKINSVFIPAKEMLSHSKGFLAMNEKYEMPFDKTLVDSIVNAELPEIRGIDNKNQKLLDQLSNIIGGIVIYEDDKFYIKKENGMKIDFSLEAEGFRKIGLLWKLVSNGLLQKRSILFWDEPEANINPEYIPIIVNMLLELQRNGVQIFVSTHDYILAKYFEVKKTEVDKVMFFSLYNTDIGVQCEKNVLFKNLKENPIVKAFDKLLDEVYDKNLGE